MQSLRSLLSRRVFLNRAAVCAGAGVAWLARPARASIPETAIGPANDPLRPAYHLLPSHNWMNDPNGPIWWKGKYHLFYQLNPHAAVWGDMHWGHAVSPDMVHWRHQPIALEPTPGGADSEGCFSGSAVVLNGVPTFIYTGVQNAPPDQVTLRDGQTRLMDETYVRQSILDPASLPLPNYRPVMPTFRGQVTEEQILQLIAYIKSLGLAERTQAP